MRITHTGADSLTVRHVPWIYWLFAALLLAGAVEQAPSHLEPGVEWVEPFFLAAVAFGVLLFWGKLVRVEIHRKRRRVELKQWGLLGLRVRVFPLDKVAAVYMERHTREGKLTQYRVVLMDGAQQLVPLTPMSFLEGGLGRTAEQMHDYLKESRGQPTAATYARS